jgi:hypothetical protein
VQRWLCAAAARPQPPITPTHCTHHEQACVVHRVARQHGQLALANVVVALAVARQRLCAAWGVLCGQAARRHRQAVLKGVRRWSLVQRGPFPLLGLNP